ncbi:MULTISPECIES: hypothetical protein [unclassified Oceanobacillus]
MFRAELQRLIMRGNAGMLRFEELQLASSLEGTRKTRVRAITSPLIT